ncbi:MAG: adenylate/guanylate cyclase domain-containing protein [Chloroflexota bacterium]
MSDRAGPPVGTVTCLFSDIEGSTRLELDLGTGPYRTVLERHQALLRAAIAAHDGHEQSTEGDSFFVIFPAAADAVRAATDAQRAITTEPWPDGITLRVRMGLHTGELEATADGVIGYAINRAARVTAAAHGGQVMLSDATRALVADDLPAGVTVRDLGEHRLKDLKAPERLFQLVIDGLPSDFPPPRASGTRPDNLPTQLTTFVGRERELAEAGALLASTRLLTLTGPGGTGKTRLSLELAAAAVERFPDGRWFVPLDAVRDPDLVVPTIGRALGLADSKDRPALDTLADSLGQRRALLVLDNFEQVVAAGRAVADLLRRCPNVTCIVTTRIALHVSGEQEYPVPGLPTPPDPSRLSEMGRLNLSREMRDINPETVASYEAVRLFVARAAAVRPGFAVTDENVAAIAALVSRLHGMPLAIELAAVRIKLLSPDRILARLDHHLAVLTDGSRDLPERQQTLRGAIAWSYDLLDDGARRLLDRLSVFRGGATPDMAEEVCGPAGDVGGEVVDRLGELVDQSLVRLDDDGDEPRFAMLETIREFAAEMLTSRDDHDETARRHAAAMLAFAQRAAAGLSGADQRAWLDRLERDHDNARAAIEWSVDHDPTTAARLAFALWRFWQQRGYLNEARSRLEAMDAAVRDVDPVDRARFAEALGGVAYWQSDLAMATHWYDVALRTWRSLDQPSEIANALYNRAYADMIAVMDGTVGAPQVAAARAMLTEALAIYQAHGDVGGEGNIVWGLGSFSYFTADAATAESWFRRALDLHRTAGDRTMETWSLHMIALAVIGQHRFDEARQVARHALQHFHEAGDISGVTLVLDDLALVALADGDRVRAGRLWGGARRLQQRTGTMLADYVERNSVLFGVPTPNEALSQAELDQAAAEAAAMSLDELVAYALGTGGGVPPRHPEGES